MPTPAYRNSSLPIAERVEDLLASLTPEEKAGQLTQYFYTGTGEPVPDDFDIESLPPEHRIYLELPKRIDTAVQRFETAAKVKAIHAETGLTFPALQVLRATDGGGAS